MFDDFYSTIIYNNLENQFKKYLSSIDKITLHYELIKYFPKSERFTEISLDAYEKEFSSNINKDNFKGYITISKNSCLHDIKSKVSQKTGFPIDTMKYFGIWGGVEYDEFGEEWTIIKEYNVKGYTRIYDSHYNSPIVTNRYVYIFIDISNNEIFSSINDNQIKNDRKINQLKEESQRSKNEISNLRRKIDKLYFENSCDKQNIDDLTEENENYRKKQKEEEKRRRQEEKNIKNFNEEFIKDKNDIKNKKYEECKKEIDKILINNYRTEFEEEERKKSRTTLSLIEKTNNFTNEFIKYSDNYVESFKKNSKKIIDEYDTKKNQISIKHINFIVIGAAGVGKSSFINQSLLLEKNKRAREGIGESVTNESHLYTSDK